MKHDGRLSLNAQLLLVQLLSLCLALAVFFCGLLVGRTLLNYWLMINNYPPTIVYEEDRRAYYDALQAYDEQEDLTPLVQFLEAQTVKTWSRSVEGKKAAPHKKLNSFLL